MDNVDGNEKTRHYNERAYALSGKIMLIAIIVLFIVVIVMLCFHVYVRCYLVRARRRTRRRSRPRFVFYIDPSAPITLAPPSRGLDAAVISSLPVFAFSSKTHSDPPECAVCLSDFQDGEAGRILPQCKHSFHIECIDMWFHSHSTCPLCRAPVEPEPHGEIRPEITVNVVGSELGSSSGGGEELNRSGPVCCSPSSSPSSGKSPSLVGVTVEVPGRNESLEDQSSCDSQSSFRLPMSHVLSLKRILSKEWKPMGCAAGCSSPSEFDSEDRRLSESMT